MEPKTTVEKAVEFVATAERQERVPRLWLWIIAAGILSVLVALIAPQQIGNLLNKSLMVVLAGIISFFLDRAFYLFIPAKLDEDLPQDVVGAARILARSLIFMGCVIGFAIGV